MLNLLVTLVFTEYSRVLENESNEAVLMRQSRCRAQSLLLIIYDCWSFVFISFQMSQPVAYAYKVDNNAENETACCCMSLRTAALLLLGLSVAGAIRSNVIGGLIYAAIAFVCVLKKKACFWNVLCILQMIGAVIYAIVAAVFVAMFFKPELIPADADVDVQYMNTFIAVSLAFLTISALLSVYTYSVFRRYYLSLVAMEKNAVCVV